MKMVECCLSTLSFSNSVSAFALSSGDNLDNISFCNSSNVFSASLSSCSVGVIGCEGVNG